MPKTYSTELTHFGFSKTTQRRPNWFAIANQLNIRPTAERYTNITNATNKKSGLYRQFATAVKNNLEAKYKNETERVIQPFSFTYKARFKNEKKWRTLTYEGQVQGTRSNVPNLVQAKYQEQIDNIEQDSPYDSKDFSGVKLGEPAVAPIVAGKLVAKGIRVARMRKTGALKLDVNYIGDTSWDRNEDTCVFDYLYHSYAGKSGFKKSLPADDRDRAYDYLDSLFQDEENQKPLEEGVSIEQIKKFCDRFDIGMIALDKNEKLIEYVRSKNRTHPPLIFIICNNHFYPIEDKHKRLSITATNQNADKPDEEKHQWKSDDYAFEEKQAKEKTEIKIVYPEPDEPTGNAYAIKIINELKTMPLPKSLRVSENTIESFMIGETMYITDRPNKAVVEYCAENEITFTGQTANSVLINIWREFEAGVEVDRTEDDEPVILKPDNIKSVVNPLVHKTLTANGVKYRTHYGATRDLSEYFEILPPMSLRMKYQETEKTMPKVADNNIHTYFGGEVKPKIKETIKTNRVVFRPKTKIEQMLIDGDAIALDIGKCYSACLKNPYDNWIKYGLEDTWTDYNGEVLTTGLYFVETNDLTLLHQTNIYSNKIIEKAIELGIELTIKKKLVHTPTTANDKPIDKNYFHPLLDLIKTKTNGKDLMKQLNNMITGYLGKTEKSTYTAELDTDYEAIWRHFLECERPENDEDFEHLFFKEGLDENGYTRFHKDNLILKTLEGINDEKAYLYGYEIRSVLNEYTLPMYIQILDWSNMRLFDLGKEIGGEIIYRHTDCLISVGGKLPHRNMTNLWGDYREEKKNFNFKSPMKIDRHIEISEFVLDWNFNPKYKTSSDWYSIMEYAIEKGGLFVGGRAGTGKSYVPKSAFKEGIMNLEDKVEVDEYGKEKRTYADTRSMSFTNKASRNIMGTTIHKLLHITSAGTIPKKTINGLKKYKYFVIDEIGMINNQLWKYLMLLKKENPKAIFILLGDWRQLPPIDEDRITDTDIFNHPVVKFLCNNNKIELTEKQRYNQQLWDFLERGVEESVWEGLNSKEVDYEEIYNSKNICYYNKTRVHINEMCMKHFKDQTDYIFLDYVPKLVKDKDGNMVKDETDRRQPVWLYVGLPVMSYKNNTKLGIVNSEEFLLTSVGDEKIILQREEGGEDLEIATDDFHEYFLANYASTAHKSQGATYTGKVILWNWDKITSDDKIAYTACSRATDLKNLVVSAGIKK